MLDIGFSVLRLNVITAAFAALNLNIFIPIMIAHSSLQRRSGEAFIAILTCDSLHIILLLDCALTREKTSKVILSLAINVSRKEIVDILHFFHLVIFIRPLLGSPALFFSLRTEQSGAIHRAEKELLNILMFVVLTRLFCFWLYQIFIWAA